MAKRKNPAAVALGRLGGKVKVPKGAAMLTETERVALGQSGGAARAQSLSAKRRAEIAKKAAAARWGKKKEG